jgi:hypothetical protein
MLLPEEFYREGVFRKERRKPGQVYVQAFLANADFDFPTDWKKWYECAVGETFTCWVRNGNINTAKDLYPVFLTRTSIEVGRSFDIKDCIII